MYTGPVNIKAFEQVGIDVMGPFPVTSSKNKYLLTITDLATRWCEVIPMVDQSATTIAQLFITHFCLRFGPPRTLLSDRGATFLSQLMTEVCKILAVQQKYTSAYHPQTNGVVERAHAVFQSGMAKLVDFQHADWDSIIPYVLHGYLTTPHAVTGYSPYYLVHGQECTQFVDIALLPHLTPALHRPAWTKFREEMLARLQLARSQVFLSRPVHNTVSPNLPEVREFPVDSLVSIWNFARTQKFGHFSKWRPKFLGPYKVLARTGPTEYTVQHCENTRDIRYYNVDDIKAYHEFGLKTVIPESKLVNKPIEVPPSSTPDEKVTEEVEIESIVSSKFIDKTEYFLVKFLHKHSSHNQWLTSSHLFCPDIIDKFRARLLARPQTRSSSKRGPAVTLVEIIQPILKRQRLLPEPTVTVINSNPVTSLPELSIRTIKILSRKKNLADQYHS